MTGYALSESSSGTGLWGDIALAFSGSPGTGASASATGSGAPSLTITTTQNHSAIAVLVLDADANNGSSRAWLTVNGVTPSAGNGYEQVYSYSASEYAAYVAYYPDAGAAGAQTVGLSAPSMQYTILAVEVLGGTEAAGAVTSTGSAALAALSASGAGGPVVPVTSTGSAALAALAASGGVIPPQMEVFADIPAGVVTSGGTDAPPAGTVETWTVFVSVPFAAASPSGTPQTFFYAADPVAPSEIFLITACPGGTGSQTWTVTRGADGAAPVAHGAGFTVVQVVSRASLKALQAVRGTTVLSGGTATVTCSTITANSLIYLTSQADGGTPGWLRVSARVPGVSFTITSSNGADASTVAYAIG
jgi:hypothetical protein